MKHTLAIGVAILVWLLAGSYMHRRLKILYPEEKERGTNASSAAFGGFVIAVAVALILWP